MAERQPFKAVLEHDYNTLFGLGLQALYELAFATHARITDEEFVEIARGWLATAKHPKIGRLFKECVYQPQLSCSHIYGRTASRPISSRQAASTSCAPSWTKLTASRESR